jgi:DHA2 family methylenomycin A resistance protein-like MFS transporter
LSPYARVSAVLFVAGLAGTVTNVSVTVVTSSLARSWSASLGEVAVAVIALNVAMAFVMPIAGLGAGRYGMRSILLAGGALLFASTILLVFAETTMLLTVGRLGQGAGMAAITPAALQASNTLLSRAEHSRALGWWSAANGAGLALGPLLGGALFDLGGWRVVPLPTLLIAVLVAIATIGGVPRGLTHQGPVRLFGVIMLSLMAGLGVAVLSALSVGAAAMALAGVAGLTLLVAYSFGGQRRSEFPLHWFDNPIVRRSGTGAFVQMFINGLAQIGVPAWLVTAGLTSSGGAGATLLAMTVTMAAMGLFTGRRFGVSYERWFKLGGWLLALGVGGLALSSSVAPWWLSIPMLVIAGVGAGCLLTPSFQAFSLTDPGKDGVGIAMYNIVRLTSFAVGGIVAAAAVDRRTPWIAFAVGAVLSALLVARTSPALTASSPVIEPADAG